MVNSRIEKLNKEIKEIETYLADAKADRDKIKEENSDFQSKVKEARENLQAARKSPITIPEKPISNEQRKIMESKTKAQIAKYISFSKTLTSVLNKATSIGLKVTTKLSSAPLQSLKMILTPTPLYDGFDLQRYEETIKTLEPRIEQNKEKLKN